MGTCMRITIASGKGGTGKTTLAVNLVASLQQSVLLLDCDVEEPNAHLFLNPDIRSINPVYKQIPQVNAADCTACGKCAEICAYNAIAVIKDKVLIFPELCHGCGGCTLLCPENAISEVGQEVGVVEQGNSKHVRFAHGKLNVGEAMAGPVIRAVKQRSDKDFVTIIDAPPGTSCSVVSTLLGSDFCVLVTEPTPFGLHDLQLAVDLVRKLGIPCGVVINRSDIGDRGVENYCQNEAIPVLMQIPNDRKIAEAYSRGKMIVDEFPEYRERFQALLPTIARLSKL